ncbi:MAG: ester cyclase [Caldilineaceae bacterium]
MSIALNQQNKQLVWNLWHALENAPDDQCLAIARQAMTEAMVWHGFDPINQLQGVEAFVNAFWLPLRHSFPDLKRQTHIFLGGESNGRVDDNLALDGKWWVSGTGYLSGTFARDYLTIPATGRPVNIRWGEFCRLEAGQMVESYFLLDLIDLMQQAGYHVLPPSLGQDGLYPPPAAGDGVLLDPQDPQITAYSRDHLRRFLFEGLNKYDQRNLQSMGMVNFFHTDVQWYGPGGIGACLNLKEFEDFHQRPWLIAYPNRQVQDLTALFAEGYYSGAPGWAGVKATHTGPYLDAPATGNAIVFNGLDWWKRVGEQYVENWVFVDMLHLFRQFGIDLLARLAEQKP